MDFKTLTSKFDTQEKCIKYLEKIRWGNRPVCVHCGSGNRITTRMGTNIHHCNKCNRDSTVLLLSPMQHSRLPLPKWFHITYLLLYTNKTARQISRETKLPYHNVWHAAMRIRCFMIPPDAGKEIKLTLREDLRKFINERGLSEKETQSVEGLDKTIQELLESYKGESGDYKSVLGYLVLKMKLRYKKLSRKYLQYYISEYVYKQNHSKKRDLFNYFLENAFL